MTWAFEATPMQTLVMLIAMTVFGLISVLEAYEVYHLKRKLKSKDE